MPGIFHARRSCWAASLKGIFQCEFGFERKCRISFNAAGGSQLSAGRLLRHFAYQNHMARHKI
jgi:hypothetical protein